MTGVAQSGRHSLEPATEPTSAPTFGRLVRVELRRLRSRRFFVVLVGIGLLGYLIGLVVLATHFEKVTPEVMARATVARDVQLQQNQAYYQQCLTDPQRPSETPVAEYCGPEPTAQDMEVRWFVDVTPFDADRFQQLTLAVGIGVGMLGLFLGATSIGAEWSSRNLVAWLFWEPRRLRLLAAKLTALLGVLLVLAVLAQLIWYVTGKILLATKGIPVEQSDPPRPEFWTGLFEMQVRAALFVIPTSLLGFGLANLMRNTAATLGVALVYLLGVETVLSSLNPYLVPYQFTSAAVAWFLPGGLHYFVDPVYDPQTQEMNPQELVFTNLQGGLVLLAYAAVITIGSAWLFRRRDIS
ncbi:ABC transporter permease subunit [Nakamurella sp. A5-74]|uniref:ABC transporter permease subunit n=1 Tax=Nakamurella sp. A5-74 TaxID=3158264 RepID=A0AAU8DR94_9ACTN